MAAPTFGTIGTQWQLGTNAPAFAVPTGVAANSVIILPIFIDGTASTITSMPTGFFNAPGSPITNPGSSGTGSHLLYVVWKRATGADSGTYTFATSGTNYVNGAAARYENVVTSGTPIESPASTATLTTNSTTTPAVSLSSSGPDRMFIFVGTDWLGGGPWTPPTGFTERLDTGDEVQELAEKLQTTTGGSGTVQATNTVSSIMSAWLGVLIGTTVASPPPILTPPQAVSRSYSW